jgi:hypothetical protein
MDAYRCLLIAANELSFRANGWSGAGPFLRPSPSVAIADPDDHGDLSEASPFTPPPVEKGL